MAYLPLMSFFGSWPTVPSSEPRTEVHCELQLLSCQSTRRGMPFLIKSEWAWQVAAAYNDTEHAVHTALLPPLKQCLPGDLHNGRRTALKSERGLWERATSKKVPWDCRCEKNAVIRDRCSSLLHFNRNTQLHCQTQTLYLHNSSTIYVFFLTN